MFFYKIGCHTQPNDYEMYFIDITATSWGYDGIVKEWMSAHYLHHSITVRHVISPCKRRPKYVKDYINSNQWLLEI
jgi:hypothetical protein